MSHPTHAKHPSHRSNPVGMTYLGPHTDTATIDVTLVLRRLGAEPTPATWPNPPHLRREDYGAHYGADTKDVENVRRFAQQHGLTETGYEQHRRILRLRGTPAALQSAFGVELGRYQMAGGTASFVGCSNTPQLPPEVIAVLGLDRRPVARAHSRRPRAEPSNTYTAIEVGQLYNFPAGTDGSGQTIAIIELGGGFSTTDLAQYFKNLGIQHAPTVTAVSVAGGSNQPGGDADGEVMLDIEVIGALAPGANIDVYFSPNTDQGFYEAISQAAHDASNKPSVISISWGGAEDEWDSASRDAMQTALQDASALGVTVTVAAGDGGSTDGESDNQPHVDFPASSPFALACGGTKLVADSDEISSEVVWNETASGDGATGGGVSAVYPLPTWQQSVGVPTAPSGSPGRGVPDVAGNADPLTGYQVIVDGQAQVIGGTSAVAPLWAALIARCNQKLGTAVGDVHAALYQTGEKVFHDITQGNNGTYKAAVGWDPCTGLGSPNGQALLDALTALKA